MCRNLHILSELIVAMEDMLSTQYGMVPFLLAVTVCALIEPLHYIVDNSSQYMTVKKYEFHYSYIILSYNNIKLLKLIS